MPLEPPADDGLFWALRTDRWWCVERGTFFYDENSTRKIFAHVMWHRLSLIPPSFLGWLLLCTPWCFPFEFTTNIMENQWKFNTWLLCRQQSSNQHISHQTRERNYGGYLTADLTIHYIVATAKMGFYVYSLRAITSLAEGHIQTASR